MSLLIIYRIRRGGLMKYIFAIDEHLRMKHGSMINEMYGFLCNVYEKVIVYHRSCAKKPLFSGDVTVISVSPACQKKFSGCAKSESFWDILDACTMTSENYKEKFRSLRAEYAA